MQKELSDLYWEIKWHVKQHSRVYKAYKNFKYGIRNLIKWFPVIWRDRDWDEFYLLKLLSFKLASMSKHHSKYGVSENSKEIVKQLKELSELANRIAEQDYTNEAFGNKKYLVDKHKMEFIKLDNGNYAVEFTGLTDEERKEMLNLHRLEGVLLERDIEKLFTIMKNDIRLWWN